MRAAQPREVSAASKSAERVQPYARSPIRYPLPGSQISAGPAHCRCWGMGDFSGPLSCGGQKDKLGEVADAARGFPI